MALTESQQRFVLHWGEKAQTLGGFNRTVAQIHALLYVMPRPLDAEEIAELLQVSRSNVSISIRELESWGLVRTTQRMGDRKTYYETLDSVWEMFRLIKVERQKRDLAPTVTVLRDLVMSGGDDENAIHLKERLGSLLMLFEHAFKVSDFISGLSEEQANTLLSAARNMIADNTAAEDTSAFEPPKEITK